MTQDRRKDDKLPEGPLVFTDRNLTAAGLAHLEAERAAACLVHAGGDVWVGVGTKDALRGLLSEDAASQSQAVPSELASRLRAAAEDTMYADHAHVNKSTLLAAASEIDNLRAALEAILMATDDDQEYAALVKARAVLDGQSLFSHSAATGKPRKTTISPEMKAALDKAAETGALVAETPDGIVFINRGHDYGDNAHLECTACGGSGHIEDQKALASPAAPLAAAVPAEEAADFPNVLGLPELASLFAKAYEQGQPVTLLPGTCHMLHKAMTTTPAEPAPIQASAEPVVVNGQIARRESIAANHDAMIILTQSYPRDAVIRVVDAHTERNVAAAMAAARLSTPTARQPSRDPDADYFNPEQVRAIVASIKPGDGWSGEDWDFALVNAAARHIGQSPAPVAADAAVMASDDLESWLPNLMWKWSRVKEGGPARAVFKEIKERINRHIATHAHAPAGRDAILEEAAQFLEMQTGLTEAEKSTIGISAKLIRYLKRKGIGSHAAEQASGGAK